MGNKSSKTPATPTDQAELVISQTLSHPIAIFSKRSCSYCVAAKKILSTETERLSHTGCTVPAPKVLELDDGTLPPETVSEIIRLLRERTGEATVPRVFVAGASVGGASDTVRYAQSGGLRMALAAASRCPPQ